MIKIAYEINNSNRKIKKKEALCIKNEELDLFLRARVSSFIKKYEDFYSVIIKIIDQENLNIKKIKYNKDLTYEKIKEKNYQQSVKSILTKKDFQKESLYRWEASNFVKYGIYKDSYSEGKMVGFINFVLSKLRIPEIEIYFLGNTNFSSFNFNYTFDENDLSLKFSNLMLNKFIALHEIAHYIVYYKKLPEMGHGKYFVGVYAYLLIRYVNINKEYIYKSIEDHGLKYINYNEVKKILTF